MEYSLVGLIAIVVLLIVNMDVILNIKGKKVFPGERFYFLFLIGVIAYHITDAFWGFLYDAKLVNAVFIDTTVYFVAMAASILLWGIFVHQYLGTKNKVILFTGFGVFAFQIILIIINIFVPIVFKVTRECEYSAQPARYAMFIGQIFIYLVLAIYTFIVSLRRKGSAKRRHIAIFFFGIFMAIAITLQVFFPLLPMYSYGYLFGVCALHSSVVEDEKANQKSELEEAKQRVSIDPLTGAMSKHAYVDLEMCIDKRIGNNTMEPFAVVVFDLNDLKIVNDTEGHNVGDEYIIKAVEFIQNHFNNKIYRIGGDEFAIILTGEDYSSREALLNTFNEKIDMNLKNKDLIIVAAGLSTYIPEKDTTFLQTFSRADREMYIRKNCLKEKK